jgi:hypothetical protein
MVLPQELARAPAVAIRDPAGSQPGLLERPQILRPASEISEGCPVSKNRVLSLQDRLKEELAERQGDKDG